MEEASSSGGAARRGGKRRRFVRGLIFWAVAGTALLLAVIWAVYLWRVPLGNWFLTEQLGLRAGFGGHRALANGGGEIDGIWLDLGEEMGLGIEVDRVGWVVAPGGLASGEVMELRLGGPRVRLDLGAGEGVPAGADGDAGEGARVEVSGAELAVVDASGGQIPRWLLDLSPRVEQVVVEGGELEIQLPAGQGLVTARFDLVGGMVGLDPLGQVSVGEQALTLRDIDWIPRGGGEGGAHRLVDSLELVLARSEEDGRWEIEELRVLASELRVGPELLDALQALAAWAAERSGAGGGGGGQGLFQPPMRVAMVSVQIGRLALGGFAGGHDLLPLATIPEVELGLAGEIEAVEVGGEGIETWGRAGLSIEDLGIGLASGPGGLSLGRLGIELVEGGGAGEWVRVERMSVEGAEVDWTRVLAEAFVPVGAEGGGGGSDTEGMAGWVGIGEVEFTGGSARIEVGEDEVVSFEFAGSGGEMQAGMDRVGGADPVRIDLGEIRWGGAGGWEDEAGRGRRARADGLRIELVPDELFGDRRRIASVGIRAPEIELDLGRLAGADTSGVEEPGEAGDDRGEGGGPPGWLSGFDIGEFTVDGGRFSLRDGERGLPTVSGEWMASTLPADGEEPPSAMPERPHELVVMGVELKTDMSDEPIFVMQEARLVARASDIWERRRIERIVLRGFEATIDELVMGLIGNLAGGEGDEVASQNSGEDLGGELGSGGWWAGSVHIEGGVVELDRVVPGIDAVRLGVESHLSEVPLGASALRLADVPQRVELKGLKIRSPYVATATVADLPVVFVDFSIGGLSERKIDKVEIISPSVFVGEHLFWYIDYYREQGEAAAAGGRADGEMVEGAPGAGHEGWDVEEVEVTGGKLYVAPKGVVLSWFPYSFPFEVKSELAKGTLESSFVIPRKTYRILPFEIEVEDLRGEVQFNLPFSTVDSNLVETLRASVLRWKEFEATDVYLTLTYDALGIYGRFGGQFYGEGSYVEGGFNVYLEESTPWDAWASASDVELLPITEILTPEYVVIDGRFDATIMGTGTLEELYQARGELTAKGPGAFEVLHFDKILEDLPPEWSPLQERLAKAGIEALRDFQYESAEGVFRGYRQEGFMGLEFLGPTGRRQIEIHVNDHPGPAPERPIGGVLELEAGG